MDRADLINYIRKHNPSIKKQQLESLSYESLIIIKTQVDVELIEKSVKQNKDEK